MTAPAMLQDQASPELLQQRLQQLLSQGLAAGANLCELFLSDEQRRLFELLQLPRRFDRNLCIELLQPAAEVASATALDALIETGLVQPVAGRAGWWQVGERHPAVAATAAAGAAGWAPLGPRWCQLQQELARWFDRFGADGALEALYHRLCGQDAGGEATWAQRYDAARDGFDLARCETLLQLLDECARFVSPALATRGTRERGLLAARAAFADDHLRTSRYLERAPLQQAFEALLQDGQHFILQLHAPGGSGKTMFLRWLGPRWCLPRGVPIARVDFDFLDASERGLASAFMLGKLAERLDPQLAGAPLFELLRDVAEERRRVLAQPEAFDAPALLRLEAEVRERLASVLVERCAGRPVLLVFDTMEDAALKHQVNVMALVQAVAALRARLQALAPHAAAAPRLVLILAGRYTLAEQYPEVQQAFAAQLVVFRIEPFGADEARRYLQQRLAGCTQAPSPEVLAAVLERADGNPFKLSLYADILLSTPTLQLAELGRGVDVDLLYLIERVLRRIPDPALRWLLRYGVLARRLTRGFVEQVLLAPLRRSLRGDRRDDDPARDGVTHRDWPRLWVAGAGAPLQAADVAELWRRLREYASASSWISVDAAGADAVVIQPTVSHAMRRALLQQDRPVVVQIHRAAIRHARRSADAAAQADLIYHDFQLRGAPAARTWWRRVQAACERDLDAAEALASVVLSGDLRETELLGAAAATPLVDAVTHARALHMLARVHGERAALADTAARAYHQAQARTLLAQFDAVMLPAGQSAIDPLRDGMLRLALLGHEPHQRELALARLETALAGRLDGATRAEVLLTLQRHWAETDPVRARRFGEQWGRLAWRQGDAASYGEHVVEQARRLLGEQQPAAALKALIQGQADLRPGPSRQGSRRTAHWSSRSEAQQARAELAGQEPGALHAAGLFEAACRRHAQLALAGTAAAPQHSDPAARLSQAELQLAAGEPQPARELAQQVAAELGGTAGAAGAIGATGQRTLSREAVLRLRIRALLVQAHAARQLMDFGTMLDLLSKTLALQSELGDHFNEVLTRLHIARVQLFDIGNLQLAAEHLQDSDTALAHEVAELRIEHRLLRAALLTLRGHAGQGLIAEAVRWLDDVPLARWRVRLHVALAGLHWGPPGQQLGHANALAEVWDRFDHVGARLMAATELRYLAPLANVPAELAARLERLASIEPLRLPGQQRLSAPDRIRLTMQRVELLRVLGRPEQARAELRALQSSIARQPAGPWLRQLASCCDRLQMDADQLLPAGWLAALAKTLSGAPMLLAVVQQEAAERAVRAGDDRRALELLLQAQAGLDAGSGLRSRWHVRQWELKLRLLDGLTEPPLQMTRQIDELQQQLGWPGNPASVPPRPPAPPSPAQSSPPASAVAVSQVVPTAITGLRVYQPDQVQPVAYRHDGSIDDKPRLALQPRFAALLDAMAAGRINEGAAPEIVSMLGQRGLQFGRLLADAVLPTRLLERLSVVLAGQLPAQEIVVEHRQSGMHAMPWELMVPAPRQYLQLHPAPSVPGHDDRPITLHAAVRRFWRAPAHFTLRARIAWVQRALAVLGQGTPSADGQLGPATAQLLRRWQRASGVPESGWADETTLAELARQIRPLVAPRPAPSVLLITPARETNIASQRGADVSGTSLEWTYRRHGLMVQTLDEPDVERLVRLQQAPQTRFEVVHIAAPIAQSRSSRELSLQFAATHDLSHTTAFSPSLLGRLLHDSPLVIVETPRSTSRDETIRQLLLRNAFAAQLFEHGELATVVAMGLASPAAQQALSDTLAGALAERVPPDELVQRLRQADPAGMASDDLFELIPSAGIALFARDPLIVHLPNPDQPPRA